MDVIERMRLDRKKLADEAEALSRQKAELEAKERDARARLAELDNALRVAERYADDEGPMAAPAVFLLRGEKLSVEEALWAAFTEAKRAKITEVVDKAQEKFGVEINRKTANNYFWNWKNLGKAGRDGHIWYWIEPKNDAPPT